jgi:ribonuclease HII
MDEDDTYILGIDEAGRGPVLGPMVIAGVVARVSHLPRFEKHIVKDSKGYSRRQREALSNLIKELASVVFVEIVEPEEIDRWVERGEGLNEMEAYYYAKIIDEAVLKGYSISVVYVDA